MALTYRLADINDREIWNHYVINHNEATLGHQFEWWLQVNKAMRLRTFYWMMLQNEQLVGVAPFVLRNHLGLGKRLVSIPYVNNGGILADSPALASEFLSHILNWATSIKVDSIELRNRYVAIEGYAVREGRSTSVVHLPGDEDVAWKMLKSTARNRVRAAQKNDLHVQHGWQHLDRFWQIYAENMKILGAPALSKRWFLALPHHLDTHLLTIWQGNVMVSGMVFVNHKDGTEDIWVGTSHYGRSLSATDLLYWEAIRWAISQGHTWLDFGRSEAGGGHERFKKKFGAEALVLPYQELHRRGDVWEAKIEEPEWLYQIFFAVWSRLPRFLIDRIGPYFSRQLY